MPLFFLPALPYDPVLRKIDDGPRYQHIEGPDGTLHLEDLWVKASDLAEAARYNPDRQNVYHLYTRLNPTVSQPMLIGNEGLLGLNNYNPARRTIILLHGWRADATSDFNRVLVPGESVARFIDWLNTVTGAVPSMYHIVGHSIGAHKAALEAAFPGWITHSEKFRSTDGAYTEVIHTNAGVLGYITPLGHVDFYPNGGVGMPGCDSQECDHARYKRSETKQSNRLRIHHRKSSDNVLMDLWTRASDLDEASTYNPEEMNTYHLFTSNSNDSDLKDLASHLSAHAVAKFLAWLNNVSGSRLEDYHIIGHGLGAHQAGIVGRLLGGWVGYITAFPGWVTNEDRFKPTDGMYTEAIHTNAGLLGYLSPVADVDFYPNGGIDMPGCYSQECDHNR
ncbi:hypothetical protein HF086_017292 [Spodoptera exigua]|uniref:Lipase domain-containing protein n=1 Tax=Spodoptera exigua TaxID=7107 RepID=A0A922LZZ5_SPOEX|nr:hypothetical protein HF086_017292 [Spodoptera exigua]